MEVRIIEYDFEGKENAITAEHLRNGETCKVVGFGQSMTPILKSGQPVICNPVTEDTELKKNDIVLCKVKGNYYLHIIMVMSMAQLQEAISLVLLLKFFKTHSSYNFQ